MMHLAGRQRICFADSWNEKNSLTGEITAPVDLLNYSLRHREFPSSSHMQFRNRRKI